MGFPLLLFVALDGKHFRRHRIAPVALALFREIPPANGNVSAMYDQKMSGGAWNPAAGNRRCERFPQVAEWLRLTHVGAITEPCSKSGPAPYRIRRYKRGPQAAPFAPPVT